MKRQQVGRMAAKVGMEFREVNSMERAQADGERWVAYTPGKLPKHFFRTLREAYDYLAIERGGQEK